MPKIDLNLYGPVEGQPGHSHIIGQPTAQEVFAQLEQHLNSIGYLPDDYFSLDRDWQNGVKFPLMPTSFAPLITAAVRASI